MAAIKWASPIVSLTPILNTSLNSLADDTTDDGGQTAINNETNLATHMDLELTLGALDVSAQTAPAVWVYLIESVDGGTDFDTYTDATSTAGLMPPPDKIAAIIDIRPGSGSEAKTAIKSKIPIPPGRFKLLLRNRAGAAFAASGNVLAYRTYSLNV